MNNSAPFRVGDFLRINQDALDLYMNHDGVGGAMEVVDYRPDYEEVCVLANDGYEMWLWDQDCSLDPFLSAANHALRENK